MVVLAINPSSTKTSYALMEFEDRFLLKCGKLKLVVFAKELPPYDRIDVMCNGLYDLLQHHKPDAIVIETPNERTVSSIYGVAIGALWKTSEHWVACNTHSKVVLIPENEWTRGQQKAQRIKIIVTCYPLYTRKGDSDGNIADAIGIAEYYCNRLKLAQGKLNREIHRNDTKKIRLSPGNRHRPGRCRRIAQ
jgi:Holliday junction resolvasome RuvABC endonuclease subunit